jgi:large subunit ribosomal protein L1
MAKHGKKYQEAFSKVDAEKLYTLEEAVKLVKETSVTKFDASVEVHVNLNLDVKKADQQIRTTVVLPHGTGKTKRVVAFVGDDQIKEAKDAGAMEAGNDDLFAKLDKEWTDFDVAVASPEMMRHLGKYGKLLGTKGLMPNPKAGTVTKDIAKAVKEIQGGRVELKTDPTGIIHQIFGKASFADNQLEENLKTFLDTIKTAKPSGSKGKYVESVSIASSMGPGIKIETSMF